MSDDGATANAPLLSAEFLARLAALEVAVRKALPSTMRGDRRASRKGTSLEFADYRAYAPGDDVRHLDWASYARLDQLVVKLYHDEEDVRLHLVVDDSASMRFGAPSKADFARRVAAALGWIGLSHQQRVGVTLLGAAERSVPLVSGRPSFPRLLERLAEEAPPSRRPLHEACRAWIDRARPRGSIVLISDLLDPAGPLEVLRAFLRPTTEVTVCQVLAREEVDPELEGDLRLIDAESGDVVEVNATDEVLAAYRERAGRFLAHCRETARRRGVAYGSAVTDEGLEEFLLRSLVGAGVLR